MSEEDLKSRADERLEAALRDEGVPDPREQCREHLRTLKAVSPEGYDRAVDHYETGVLPRVASGEADPLAAWIEFARFLADLRSPGRVVEVDEEGRSRDHEPPPRSDALLLHLPESRKERALLVALPASPTPAQQATLDLLVRGRQKLPE